MELKKRCLIVYNPMSGKGIKKEIIEMYIKTLSERGYTVDVTATERKNHATEAVEAAGSYDVVFSIGGDGTLNEVIRGNFLRENKLTICPLPSGTCNDVASMLGYGNNPTKNLDMALSGEVNYIDIATINDNPFVYVAGMGKFMNISYDTSSEDKRKKGYKAYIKESAIELFKEMKRYRAEVTVDGVKLDGSYSLIMISNANHIAGINHFYKDVCLDDGEMEVLLCKAKTKREFVKCFLRFFIRGKTDGIISLKARDITVKMLEKPEKNWCMDGEKYQYDGEDYNIKVSTKMKILTPKINSKKLFNGYSK